MTKRSFNNQKFIIFGGHKRIGIYLWLMFKKETEYALRALIYIQSCNLDNRRPGIAEIAAGTDAPRPFIAKILHNLVRHRLLESLKGKNGGFFFDASNPDLPLKDLITLIEGNKLFTGCGFGMSQCDENNPCPLHDRYSMIRNAFNDLVSNESIQSLAGKKRNEILNNIVKLYI